MTNHLLTLPEAFERVSGHRPHLCTLWRWTTKGCKGVKLQIAFLGGKRMTTERWAQDFIDAVSEVNLSKHTVAPMQPPRQQERNAEKAAKKLAKRLKPGAAK
jgi:hypothetical protein